MKRLLCLCLLLSTLLSANELVDLYLDGGIGAVEERIETLLAEKDYWLKKIDPIDTRFGYFEDSRKFLFVVDKSKSSLSIYRYEGGKLILDGEHNVVMGDSKGDKFREGDKKTPVGSYRVLSLLSKGLDPYYGPYAFTTNYPNNLDKKLGKTGHGIWLHGMPLNGERADENTKGCIAVDNDLITRLQAEAKPENIILMINESGAMEAEKNELAEIMALLYQWRRDWKESNIESYLNLYSADFRRSDGLSRAEFELRKRAVFAKKYKKVILFSNFEVVPYPNSFGDVIYRARLWQDYTAEQHKSSKTKELYLRKENGRFLIVSEN
ncbi:MAG: L,D-transpeptidase family protein [Helicobacteraceae bacterium]|jgi:murein L,D-transpeptidase YafK|nr:L,D-transpeptidase family protein [Helicobacteraceae bacterium]